MIRLPEHARLARANRAWVRAELSASGIPDADTWCDRWESEARRIGLDPRTEDFWTLGSVWIKERCRPARP